MPTGGGAYRRCLGPLSEPLSLPARTRPPDQPSYDSDPDRDELQKLLGNLRSDCDADTDEGCGVNEVCNFVVRETVMGAVCECRRGYTRESQTQECVGELGGQRK